MHASAGTPETQLPSEVDLLLQTLRVLYAVIPYLNVLSDRAPELTGLWRRFGHQDELSQDGAPDLQTLHTLAQILSMNPTEEVLVSSHAPEQDMMSFGDMLSASLQ
jgi:hypothetical protein